MARRKSKDVDGQEMLMDTEHEDAAKLRRAAAKYNKFVTEVYKPACTRRKELEMSLVLAMQNAGLPVFKQGGVFIQVKEHDPTIQVRIGTPEPAGDGEAEAA